MVEFIGTPFGMTMVILLVLTILTMFLLPHNRLVKTIDKRGLSLRAQIVRDREKEAYHKMGDDELLADKSFEMLTDFRTATWREQQALIKHVNKRMGTSNDFLHITCISKYFTAGFVPAINHYMDIK